MLQNFVLLKNFRISHNVRVRLTEKSAEYEVKIVEDDKEKILAIISLFSVFYVFGGTVFALVVLYIFFFFCCLLFHDVTTDYFHFKTLLFLASTLIISSART